MLIPLLAMIRKDLRLFFADRRAVIMSFAMPIVIASFFGAIFSGSGTAPRARVAIGMADEDGSAIAKGIVAGASERRQPRRHDRHGRRDPDGRGCGQADRRRRRAAWIR